jgi:two-component system, chemotaxis family, sensor kinase CheA
MAIDGDEELLQDFLVEAENILEQLGQQLVVLKNDPVKIDLSNSVFREFHTIKSDAGVNECASLANVCLRGKELFNFLRQGRRRVDAGLMVAVCSVVHCVNSMFDELYRGSIPERTDPAFITSLKIHSASIPSGMAGIESRQQLTRAQ